MSLFKGQLTLKECLGIKLGSRKRRLREQRIDSFLVRKSVFPPFQLQIPPDLLEAFELPPCPFSLLDLPDMPQ